MQYPTTRADSDKKMQLRRRLIWLFVVFGPLLLVGGLAFGIYLGGQ